MDAISPGVQLVSVQSDFEFGRIFFDEARGYVRVRKADLFETVTVRENVIKVLF